MKKLLLVLFFTMFPVLAHAATYYVAMTGSNSNSCSSAQTQTTPKLTISAGISCLASGDTLIVKAGTYNETIDDTIPNGSPDAYTLVKSEVKGGAILRPDHLSSTDGFSIVAIGRAADRNYIQFDGFVVDGSQTRTVGMGGVVVTIRSP